MQHVLGINRRSPCCRRDAHILDRFNWTSASCSLPNTSSTTPRRSVHRRWNESPWLRRQSTLYLRLSRLSRTARAPFHGWPALTPTLLMDEATPADAPCAAAPSRRAPRALPCRAPLTILARSEGPSTGAIDSAPAENEERPRVSLEEVLRWPTESMGKFRLLPRKEPNQKK